eukprot:PhF_6_TR25252/c0_g1_i1/m.34770
MDSFLECVERLVRELPPPDQLTRKSVIQNAEEFTFSLLKILSTGLHDPLVLWNVVSNLGDSDNFVSKLKGEEDDHSMEWLLYHLNEGTLSQQIILLRGMYGVIQTAYHPSAILTQDSSFETLLKTLQVIEEKVTFRLNAAGTTKPRRGTVVTSAPPEDPSQTSLPMLPEGMLEKCDPSLVKKLRESQPNTPEHNYLYHQLLIQYHKYVENEKRKAPSVNSTSGSDKKNEGVRGPSPPAPITTTQVVNENSEMSFSTDGSNSPGGPTKHRMKLFYSAPSKPSSFADKSVLIEQQHGRCKQCLLEMKPVKAFLRGPSWDGVASFCFYTGFMYCKECHTGDQTTVIPARMLHQWDFGKYPVCKDAFAYLETIWQQPVLCISAINPTLFDRVVALRIARQIRVQLQLFHEICKECPTFQTAISGFKPMMYHMENTEMYSPEDIYQFRKCSISASREADKADLSALYFDDFINTLKNMRSTCIQHVVRMCRTGCYAKAAKSCGRCQSTEAIFTFDINNTIACPKCHVLYHRSCYKTGLCVTCNK